MVKLPGDREFVAAGNPVKLTLRSTVSVPPTVASLSNAFPERSSNPWKSVDVTKAGIAVVSEELLTVKLRVAPESMFVPLLSNDLKS